jgi:hypothetical protein
MLSGWLCDRIGPRKTTMCFLCWMTAAVFATFFAPSLPVLAFGMAMCGVGWGSFQTMTTAYASEVVPTVLRPYVTAWVCMCWGLGILISSAVVRAVVNVQGDLGESHNLSNKCCADGQGGDSHSPYNGSGQSHCSLSPSLLPTLPGHVSEGTKSTMPESVYDAFDKRRQLQSWRSKLHLL